MLNLTPHAIVLRHANGTEVSIPASGAVARVKMEAVEVGTHAGVPVVRNTPGPVEGLPNNPEAHGGVLVSGVVLAALPEGTPGVFAPDTGPTAIRNDKGHIVAVTRLVAR